MAERWFEPGLRQKLREHAHPGGIFRVGYQGARRDVPAESFVDISLPDTVAVDKTFRVFEDFYLAFTSRKAIAERVVVFIGHGQDQQWRDLKDHLHEKHGFKVEAYETASRGGQGVAEVVLRMIEKAQMALLVHTGENMDADGLLHARDNVVHETGIAQGILSTERAIVLLEDGCTPFSNISGLTQIRFPKGDISKVYGEVLATIKREFGAS